MSCTDKAALTDALARVPDDGTYLRRLRRLNIVSGYWITKLFWIAMALLALDAWIHWLFKR